MTPRLSATTGLWLLAACTPDPARPGPVTPGPAGPPDSPPPAAVTGTPIGAARLVFAPPDGLAWTRASGFYGDADVLALPWDGADLDGDERDAAFEGAWAGVAREVGRRDAPLWWSAPSAVVEERDLTDRAGRPARGVLAVPGFYSREGERQWDVLADAGPALVRVSSRGPRDPDALLTDALTIARAQTPGSFHLGTAALAVPFQGSESVTVELAGRAGRLTVLSRSGGTLPIEPPLRQRAAESEGPGIRRLLGPGGVTTLRNRDRTVAGLAGREAVLEIAPRGEPGERTHAWEYRGDGGARERFVAVEWTVGLDVPAQPSLAAWDALLDSFRPAYAVSPPLTYPARGTPTAAPLAPPTKTAPSPGTVLAAPSRLGLALPRASLTAWDLPLDSSEAAP